MEEKNNLRFNINKLFRLLIIEPKCKQYFILAKNGEATELNFFGLVYIRRLDNIYMRTVNVF